ncbi:hypothetical protein HK405_012792, partial [Cladochytrium tenue]
AVSFVQGRDAAAAISWAVAGLFRSNGVLFAGFFAYRAAVAGALLPRSLPARASASPVRRLWRGIKAAALAALVLSGFAAFQAHGFWTFCVPDRGHRPWCASAVPLLYSFVQEHYWNNGFLRYWTPQQIPNFLLAAPMIVLSGSGIQHYIRQTWPRAVVEARGRGAIGVARELCRDARLPFYVLWAVFTVYASLFMHVQVVTRVFTCLPPVYWHAAELCKDGRKVVLYYFIGYAALTTVLLANFYPPA